MIDFRDMSEPIADQCFVQCQLHTWHLTLILQHDCSSVKASCTFSVLSKIIWMDEFVDPQFSCTLDVSIAVDPAFAR